MFQILHHTIESLFVSTVELQGLCLVLTSHNTCLCNGLLSKTITLKLSLTFQLQALFSSHFKLCVAALCSSRLMYSCLISHGWCPGPSLYLQLCLSFSASLSLPLHRPPSCPPPVIYTKECARLQIFVMLIGHSVSCYTGRHHS